MKDLHTDANFPRTADHRVYHLGLRPGEVANRIIAVGSSSRAESIALLFDDPSQLFRLTSERGFLTITGRYRGIPISVASLGMGYPNMDFFVRETRECLSGDMVVIRLGSCGGLIGLPVGSLVVPKASVSIHRNVDFDFTDGSTPEDQPYRISKSVPADTELYTALVKTLKDTIPSEFAGQIASDVVNASADSFYSSQGRQTSFADHNEDLIQRLLNTVPDVASLEMETFHLFHLASVWRPSIRPAALLAGTSMPGSSSLTSASTSPLAQLPPTNLPVTPFYTHPPGPSTQSQTVLENITEPVPTDPSSQFQHTARGLGNLRTSRIRAAAVQMIFASRTSHEFITPDLVSELENWSGRAALEALAGFDIPKGFLHEEVGSVWEDM